VSLRSPSLTKDLNVNDVIDELRANNILNSEDEQNIISHTSREACVRELLAVLPTRGPKAYSVFQDALQERYPWLVVILQGAEISTPVSPSKCFADTLKCFAGTSECVADTSKCSADTSECVADTSKCFTDTSECVADTSKCFADTCSSNPAHSRNVGPAFPDLLYKANGQPCDKTVESIQIGPVYENCKTQESLSSAPPLPPRLGTMSAPLLPPRNRPPDPPPRLPPRLQNGERNDSANQEKQQTTPVHVPLNTAEETKPVHAPLNTAGETTPVHAPLNTAEDASPFLDRGANQKGVDRLQLSTQEDRIQQVPRMPPYVNLPSPTVEGCNVFCGCSINISSPTSNHVTYLIRQQQPHDSDSMVNSDSMINAQKDQNVFARAIEKFKKRKISLKNVEKSFK